MNEPTCIEYIGQKSTPGCIRQISVGSRVCSISFTNRNKILSGSPSGVCLWSVDRGNLIRKPFLGDASVSSSYLGNGIAVVNRDGVINEWSADTDEIVDNLPTVDIGHVTSVVGDYWQYYAIGSEDGAIRLCDRRKGTMIEEPLRGHSGKVLVLSFSAYRPHLASGSDDQSIIVWDVERREMKYPPLKAHSGPITSLEFTYWSENLISGSLDGTVRLWDVVTGEMLHAFSASGMGSVYSVAICDRRHILSGSEDGIIRVWDTKHKEIPPKKFIGHTSRVISLAVDHTPSSIRFASGSSDEMISIWEMERKHVVAEGSVYAIAVSANGEYLVSGSFSGTVSVWRIETGELIKGPLGGHIGWVTSLSFSPDGFHFASGSTDGTVQIWNLEGVSVTCSSVEQSVRAVCFSPDGNCVASGHESTIRVWDSRSGELSLGPFRAYKNEVISVCYSPDGNRIVSGSDDKTICIWDASNGTLLLTLQGHSDGITSVTYSHNSLYILSGFNDGTIRVWNADNGRLVRELMKAHENSVISVCFSPDDRYFVSGSPDSTARVWNTSTGELLFKTNVSSTVSSVVFLPSFDSKYIKFVSASTDGLIRIWIVDVGIKEKVWNAPDENGWVTGDDKNILFWLPSNICSTLIYGSCIRILNSRLSTRLTLSKYQGNQWTSCLPSSTIV